MECGKNMMRVSFKSYDMLHTCAKYAQHLIIQAWYWLDAGEVNNQLGLSSGTETHQVQKEVN